MFYSGIFYNASLWNIKNKRTQPLRRLCWVVGFCFAISALFPVSVFAQTKTSTPFDHGSPDNTPADHSPVDHPLVGHSLVDRKLIIGVSEWAPYMGYNLPGHGLVVETLKIAMERAGIGVEVKAIPWSRLLKEVYDGKIDLIPGLWYKKDRAKNIAYGAALAENRLVLISHKDFDRRKTSEVAGNVALSDSGSQDNQAGRRHRINSLDDLVNLYVGIAQDYAYPKAFSEAQYFKRDVSKNLEVILKKIEDRRVDAALADELVARHTANLLFPGRSIFYYGNEAIDVKNLYIGISRKTKGYKEILQLIDKHLAVMKVDGTYHDLLIKHGLKEAVSQ